MIIKKNSNGGKEKSMNKKLYLAIFSLLAIVLVGSGVSAVDCTLVFPTTTIGSTGTSNITATTSIISNNITNMTFWYDTDGSGAFTWVNASVKSQNATNFTTPWITTSLTDGNSYRINITGYNMSFNGNNDTFVVCSSITTGISVDQTSPTARISLSTPSTEPQDPLGVTADCSGSEDNVDSTLDYNFTLVKPDNTLAHSTSSSSYDIADSTIEEPGEYAVRCTVTNQVALSTTSENQTFLVSSDDEIINLGTDGSGTSPTGGDKGTVKVAFILISSVAVIIGALYIFNESRKNKHKKRR